MTNAQITAQIEAARAKSHKIAVAAGMKTEAGALVGFFLLNKTESSKAASAEISKIEASIRELEAQLATA